MRFTKFFAGVTFALSASQASATVSPGEVAETFERLTNIASDIIQTVASLDSTKIITSVPVCTLILTPMERSEANYRGAEDRRRVW